MKKDAYTVNLAALLDIPALVKLEQNCFTTDRLSCIQFRRFITKQSAVVLAVKKKNKLIGSAVLLFRKNSSIARLYSIAIHPDCQGLGIAQLLYQQLEKQAIKRQVTEIRLEVRTDNSRAIQFYTKHGFIFFGEYQHFYEDAADALRMKKIL